MDSIQQYQGHTVVASYPRINSEGSHVRENGQREYTGRVLGIRDPRAWESTIVAKASNLESCMDYAERHPIYVPVEWEFGRVYWERAASLIIID